MAKGKENPYVLLQERMFRIGRRPTERLLPLDNVEDELGHDQSLEARFN